MIIKCSHGLIEMGSINNKSSLLYIWQTKPCSLSLLILLGPCREWICLELLLQVWFLHFLPLLLSDDALVHFLDYLLLIFAHVLPYEDKALLSGPGVFGFCLVVQGRALSSDHCLSSLSPGVCSFHRNGVCCLTPFKEGIRVIGQPDEALGSEQVLEWAFILLQ